MKTRTVDAELFHPGDRYDKANWTLRNYANAPTKGNVV